MPTSPPRAPAAKRSIADILRDHEIPWYLILRESRVIRVYHGDLDQSWWQRGMLHGERMVEKVESVIRLATGLQRVTRRHTRECVDFMLSAELFDRAAVAVRLSFPYLADTNDLTRQMLSYALPAPRPAKVKKPPRAKQKP